MLLSRIAENILYSFLSLGVEGCREAWTNGANKRPSLDSHLLALLFLSLLSHFLGFNTNNNCSLSFDQIILFNPHFPTAHNGNYAKEC